MSRNIFAYRVRNEDGSEEALYADPLVLERRFTQALEGNPNPALADAQLPTNPDGSYAEESPPELLRRYAAEEKIARAALFAFELEPFDRRTGKGWREGDLLSLVWDWIDWAAKKNESTVKTPKSATTTPA